MEVANWMRGRLVKLRSVFVFVLSLSLSLYFIYMITVLQAYLKSKILECQCWPLAWEVLATPDTKVTFKNLFKYIAFTYPGICHPLLFWDIQVLEPCSPAGLSCYERNRSSSFNCTTQCLGLYADVSQVLDEHLFVKDQAKLFAIADVHERRKQEWAHNIFFDPDGDEESKWGKKVSWES